MIDWIIIGMIILITGVGVFTYARLLIAEKVEEGNK